LDPGNVLTLNALSITTGDGEGVPSGFADFRVIYAVSYANYVEAEITARTQVAGTETTSMINFQTVCSKPDADAGICPIQNPFGIGDCSQPD
jgi:hypothetical protein